jgi:hypothetical protein
MARALNDWGVTPDELVLPTAMDLSAHLDPVLSRAAAMLGVTIDLVKVGAFTSKKRSRNSTAWLWSGPCSGVSRDNRDYVIEYTQTASWRYQRVILSENTSIANCDVEWRCCIKTGAVCS